MKKIVLFLLFILGVTTISYAQDTLVATHYSERGKIIRKLKEERLFILNKISIERTEATVQEGKKLIMSGYLKKSVVVKTETTDRAITVSRQLIIVDKSDTHKEYEFLLTLTQIKVTGKLSFIVTLIKNKEATVMYLGKVI